MPAFCARTLHFAAGELICLPGLDTFIGTAAIAAAAAPSSPLALASEYHSLASHGGSSNGRVHRQSLQIKQLQRALRDNAAPALDDNGNGAAAAAVAITAVTEWALEASNALCFLDQGEVEILVHCQPHAPLVLPLPAVSSCVDQAHKTRAAVSFDASSGSGSDVVVAVDELAAQLRNAHELHRLDSMNATSEQLVSQSSLTFANGARTEGSVQVAAQAQSGSLDATVAALRARKLLGRVRAGDFFNHAALFSSSSTSLSLPLQRNVLCVARSACTVRVATALELASIEGAGTRALHAQHPSNRTGSGSGSASGSGSDACAAVVARAWQRELMASVMRQMQQMLQQQQF